MTYKQTDSGVLRIIQETVLLSFSLLIVSYIEPSILPVSESVVMYGVGLTVLLWIIAISTINPKGSPTLSSEKVDRKYLDLGATDLWRESMQNYASGHIHTKVYLGSRLYSKISRSILIGSSLALIFHSFGGNYLLGVLVLYILLPTLYAIRISQSEVRGVSSLEDPSFKSDIENLVNDLSDFFDVESPRVHVAKSRHDNLYVVKSLAGNTLIFSPEQLENIGSDEPDLDLADRFKLAHEFAHLSIGTKYTLYSQASLIALSSLYYIVVTQMSPNPLVLVCLSVVFVFGVRLVGNYIQRSEEFESDKLAAQFVGADKQDCVFALVSVTNSDENPFTYPRVSIIGKLYTLFDPHPPIVSRIDALINTLDGDDRD